MNTHISPRVEFVVHCLRDAGPQQWPEIAKKTGVSHGAIRKIAYGETKDPRSSNTDALHSYFEAARKKGRRETDKQ